jgi:preprotein translocase subunit SecA
VGLFLFLDGMVAYCILIPNHAHLNPLHPCLCRFFLSLEDNIFRIFGGDKIKNLMVAFRVEDLPMESQMLTDALDVSQKRVENYFFDIRK